MLRSQHRQNRCFCEEEDHILTVTKVESIMAQKKPTQTAATNGGAGRDVRSYPPEAYTYDDDVSPAAIDVLKKRANVDVTKSGWKVIDGFGVVVNV
jgi:hypothetical protein